MDLKTAVAILNQQVMQLMGVVQTIQVQSAEVSQLADFENNSIPDPEDQIKSMMASMTIQMTALSSQDVIVQQAIDRISEILNN